MSDETKSRGLGDDIEKVMKSMKVDELVDRITRSLGIDDCGCNKRRDKLNDMFPHKSK